MSLTRDGKVLSYGSNANGQQTGRFIYDVWTPGASAAANHTTLSNTTRTDLFCNVQVTDPNTGRVVMFGGDVYNGSTSTNSGNPDIVAYDPNTQALAQLPGMARNRWYAGAVTLPNGDIYVQGGAGGEDRAEVWRNGTATLLPFSTSGVSWWYPRMYVQADGSIFGFDTSAQMFRVNPGLTSLTVLGQIDTAFATDSWSAVPYTAGQDAGLRRQHTSFIHRGPGDGDGNPVGGHVDKPSLGQWHDPARWSCRCDWWEHRQERRLDGREHCRSLEPGDRAVDSLRRWQPSTAVPLERAATRRWSGARGGRRSFGHPRSRPRYQHQRRVLLAVVPRCCGRRRSAPTVDYLDQRFDLRAGSVDLAGGAEHRPVDPHDDHQGRHCDPLGELRATVRGGRVHPVRQHGDRNDPSRAER